MKSRVNEIILLMFVILAVFSCTSAEDTSLEPYLIPWKYDSAAEMAQANGELHFFFMAGEGYIVNPGTSSSDPKKWGDSCLVAFPNGQLMLIDAGMPKYAPILIENLRRLGVEKLDYLVISHQHDDHAGSVYTPDGLLDHIKVDQAYFSGVYNYNWSEPQLLERVFEAHQVPYQVISDGYTMDIGEVHIQVLNPSPDLVGQTMDTTPGVNNASIVMRMDYRDFSALFTGDLYAMQELELVKTKGDLLDVDLLKIPHHGHDTSSSRNFAQAVSPKLAVGTGSVVIQGMLYYNYTRDGAKVLFDYCDGYIHVISDGEKLTWEQSRVRETDFYDKYEYENLQKLKNK